MSTFSSRRLSGIPPRPVFYSPPPVDLDERITRQVEHQALIEAAFDRAEEYERLGDAEIALEWLDRADALSGGPSPASRMQRARFARAPAPERAPRR